MNRYAYYEELGVPPTATDEEIKAAYRRRAKATHPDANGSAEEFAGLQRAYACLGNPGKRAEYDEFGEDLDLVGQAHSMLSSLFDKHALKRDPVEQVTKAVQATIHGAGIAKGDADSQLIKVRAQMERIKNAPILLHSLESKLDALTGEITRLSAVVKMSEVAQEILETYEFEAE